MLQSLAYKQQYRSKNLETGDSETTTYRTGFGRSIAGGDGGGGDGGVNRRRFRRLVQRFAALLLAARRGRVARRLGERQQNVER